MNQDPINLRLPVEVELMAEKASALAHAADKLEQALAALAAADEALAGASAEVRATRLAVRRERRHEAARRLWYLVVQREAIGLRSHEDVYRFYRIPPEIRVWAGT